MLVEVQPGTYINPADIAGIEEYWDQFYDAKWVTAYVTLRSGAKFTINGKTAQEVRAILWPDEKSPTRLAE